MSGNLILPGQTIPGSGLEEVRQGDWYWQTFADDERILVCITHVGSNYVEVESVYGHETRIHDDEFHERLVPEPNAERVIECETAAARDNVHGLISEMQTLCRKLGVAPAGRIVGPAEEPTGETTALAVVSRAPDVRDYETTLLDAKDKKIPALQEKIKHATTELGHWLSARAIPLGGLQENLKDVLKATDDRLFSVRIYAGLAESATLIQDGEPARADERIRLMQRRLYMDEECIAGYKVGGIDCQNIGDFDRWLLDGNVARLLPFPRCIVSFRVRHNEKDRGPSFSIGAALLKLELADADKTTFLYMRNGGKIWRLNAEFDFGERLFPAKGEFDLTERNWVRVFCGRPDLATMIDQGEYDLRVAAYAEKKRRYDEWRRKNPQKPGKRRKFPPHEIDCSWGGGDPMRDYEPFDQTSVYFDDIAAQIQQDMDSYNRIVILLQGILDRSTVFHPHLPARLWTPGGAEEILELIYDGSNVLTDGEPPNFEAYRQACNRSLKTGSVTYGQQDYWERIEAEKENSKRERSRWGRQSEYRHTTFRPYGNPGPGEIARVGRWMQRTRKAVYTWTRERQRYQRYGSNDRLPASIAVPAAELLNLDAYKPGDFRQFYADPRTRRQYLKWAAALLTAEEYAAGNVKVDTQEG